MTVCFSSDLHKTYKSGFPWHSSGSELPNFAGAICYENYYQINEKKRLDYLYDQVLFTTRFEDKNHNEMPDDDEPVDANTTYYYYGENELSKEDYASMQIEGDYQPLVGDMTFDELKAALAK